MDAGNVHRKTSPENINGLTKANQKVLYGCAFVYHTPNMQSFPDIHASK